MGKCLTSCPCLCHDTGGGVHDHQGRPCPGKGLERTEVDAARQAALEADGAILCGPTPTSHDLDVVEEFAAFLRGDMTPEEQVAYLLR